MIPDEIRKPFVILANSTDKEYEDIALDMADDPELSRILTLDDRIIIDRIRRDRGLFRNTSIMAAQEEADDRKKAEEIDCQESKDLTEHD